MISHFISAAEEEFSDAAVFYENKRNGLGRDFIEAVMVAVARLEKLPQLGTPIDYDFRSLVISRFPYSIIYRISDDEIRIVAIAHQSRRPQYWHNRRAN